MMYSVFGLTADSEANASIAAILFELNLCTRYYQHSVMLYVTLGFDLERIAGTERHRGSRYLTAFIGTRSGASGETSVKHKCIRKHLIFNNSIPVVRAQ